MTRLVTSAEMRAIEAASGVAGQELMERAGAAVARAARAHLGPGGKVLILCGGGNNGGDGYVAGRRLRADGVDARVVALAPRAALKGDARAAADAAAAAGLPILPIDGAQAIEQLAAGPGDVVLDALFGTGLSRPAEGAYALAIARCEALRGAGAKVVAVDVPSGLSSDTGQPLGPCVHADATVTFGFLKRGLVLQPGPTYAGEVTQVDLGIPAQAAAQVPVGCELLTDEAARALLPPRKPDAHKGDAGRVLVIAGSSGKTGAAHLALTGALRGGAGLVTLAARPEVFPLALQGRPEAMSVELPGSGPIGPADLGALVKAAAGMDALVIGPGIPRGEETGATLRALLDKVRAPVVLDADALNALAEARGSFSGLPVPAVLTPHPGEMARLVNDSIEAVQADRVGIARSKSRAWRCVVVLKGSRTVVAAPEAPPCVIPTGNAGMATGGTGDVLAGLVGALLASRLPSYDAARVAAYVHGAAGDLAAERWGQRGLLASDLADALGGVWARWSR